jgi:predicted kinase
MLVVFAGLPATGKSTIAQLLAHRCGATYLRIDTIEQAIRSANVLAGDIGPAGYAVAYALAETNLRFGRTVVADCVNPVAATRAAWRSVAAAVSSPIIDVEIVCSDPAEHRRRVEQRSVDVPDLAPPTWAQIQAAVAANEYEPWSAPRLVIDTTHVRPADAAATIIGAMHGQPKRSSSR